MAIPSPCSGYFYPVLSPLSNFRWWPPVLEHSLRFFGFGLQVHLAAIDRGIHPLETEGAQRHGGCASSEQTHAAVVASFIKDWVGVKTIVPVALLSPEPVRNGDEAA